MKACKKEGCFRPVWGKGFCLSHQYLRQDKPKKPLFKRQESHPTHTMDFGFDSQEDMFTHLWSNARDAKGYVKCQYTGQPLNGFAKSTQWYWCFAHILNKKNYTYFKLNPANIAIVHPEFHRIIDQGTTKDREKHPEWKWEAWDRKVIQMKEEYNKFKFENHLA